MPLIGEPERHPVKPLPVLEVAPAAVPFPGVGVPDVLAPAPTPVPFADELLPAAAPEFR